jgi:hypothetical protein
VSGLQVSHYETPSLTRGWVCNFLVQLLPGFANTVTLRPKSDRTHDDNLLSHMRLPQPEGPVPFICIPRNRVAPLHPKALGSICIASYNTHRYGGGILAHLNTGTRNSQCQSYLMTDGQSTSLSWYQATIWEPQPIFLSRPLKIFSDNCSFLLVGNPPSGETGL